MDNYTIYHAHDDMSLLDSATKYDDYIYRAKELGMTSFGLSNHGNIFNWIKKKQKCDELGLKYVHGQEFYITLNLEEKVRDNWHCILIAKNYEGVKELNRLSSIGYTRDGHYYYDPRITLQELINTSDNIIITSACLGGLLNSGIDDVEKIFIDFMIKNKHRCFLEIQHHNNKDQSDYNKKLHDLSNHYGIRLIAGTDTHSLDAKHAKLRTILQKSKNINFPNEESWDLVFKSYDELVQCYINQDSLPKSVYMEAIENTNVMADMIENFELDLSYKYPKIYDNSDEIFKSKVYEGLKNKGLDRNKEYIKRIEYETKAIAKNGAIDYLLLQEKITSWCRKNDILPGYSRGSVSGCLCAYLMGITDIDSVKFNMNFERFMNAERVSLSDIDIDYPPNKREQVKEYIFNDLGLNCCDIVAFNTVAEKGSLRDVGRALEIPLEEINEMSKNIGSFGAGADEKKYPELFDLAKQLEGTITSSGVHPCGVVTSTLNLDEELGTFTTSTDIRKISQVDMKGIDSINFVKLDILGLDNIQIINETCDLSGIKRLTPDNMNFEDEKVWNDIIGNSLGVFQWESDFAHQTYKKLFSKETLEKIKKKIGTIDRLALLSMANGAIRPAGESYREPMCDGEFKDNGHEALNEMLSQTMGYCIDGEEYVNTYGGNKKIKNVKENDKIYTKDGLATVTKKFYNGKKDVYEIEFSNGTSILCTKDHKILTFDGYKKLSDINIDDTVAYKLYGNNNEDYDVNKIKTIAWLLGDGILNNKNNVSFVNADIDVINEFSKCVKSSFDDTDTYIVNRHSRVNKYDLYYCNVKHMIKSKKRTSISQYLDDIGLKYNGGGKTARDKFIPKFIFNLNNELLKNFLGAFLDTDATITSDGIVYIRTSSLFLAKDIKEIGRLLGYNFCINKSNDDSYIVVVNNSKVFVDDILKYTIKFSKKEIFNNVKRISIDSSVNGKIGRDIILSSIKKSGMKIKPFLKKYNIPQNIIYVDRRYVRTNTLRKIPEKFLPEEHRESILNDKIIYLKIRSIKKYEDNRDVYDLYIEDGNNYLSNGVIVHNCIYQEQVIQFLHEFCGYSMGQADVVRRGFAKKSGTEKHIPKIKAGFIKTMKEKYNTPEEESEKIVESFLRVIEDSSFYLFSLNHALPYSMIGYACAYLRYYHKLEFITTMLNINKDNIEKSASIIDYAKENKILIKSPKFIFSRSSYFFDRETNSIYKDITSIKYLNSECGEQLFEIGKMEFEGFVDFLMYVEENLKINSRQLETLIKIKFFDEFGNNKKLLTIYEEFSKGKNKYDKKLKEETKLKRLEYLRELEKTTPNEFLNVLDQIYFEQEALGYIQATYEKIDKRLVFVSSLDTKYAPRAEVYCLANGKTTSLKLYRKTYNNNPFGGSEILYCKNFEQKAPIKFVNGQYLEDMNAERQWWLTNYVVVTPEQFNKILEQNG